MVPDTVRIHFIALDSLRGIAAVMVALFHFRTTSPVDGTVVLRQAWVFVDFFFVLSGFVIASNYRARLSAGFGVGSFMLLRIGRLYPLHIVMLMAFIITELAIMVAGPAVGGSGRQPFTGQTDPWAIITNLALISGLGVHSGLTWNGVAWSVSTEMWTYLVFALGVVVMRRESPFVGLVLAGCGLALITIATFQPAGFGRFVDIARCLYGFGVGCLLYEVYLALSAETRSGRRSVLAMSLLEAVALGLALVPALTRDILPPHVLTPIAFAPAVLIFAFDCGLVSRLLAGRVFVIAGVLSYSIYMIHPFVQSRLMLPAALLIEKRLGIELVNLTLHGGEPVQLWGTTTTDGTILAVFMLLIVFALSALAYRLIEAPGRKLARRIAASMRPSAAGVVVS